MDNATRELMEEQKLYYRQRAPTYDDWWLRVGRYDEGPERNERWFAEIAELEGWLRARGDLGDVIELAAGTGLWTRRLAGQARSVLAVDASRETLSLNRGREHAGRVEFMQADLFALQPTERFDTVFFGFWLSHVPAGLFDRFWALVHGLLRPGGRALFIDTLGSSTAWEFASGEKLGDRVQRRDLDGAHYRVVKQPLRPAELSAKLAKAGWSGGIGDTGTFFVRGELRQPRDMAFAEPRCTCEMCPVQFEGRLTDGRAVYIRESHDRLTVSISRVGGTVQGAVMAPETFVVPMLDPGADARGVLAMACRAAGLVMPDDVDGL